MNSPSTLLEKLSKISNENTISVFVPSANRDIKFKALNIKQQKDLIKTALDGAAAGATLNQVLNDIIISNSTEQFEFKVYDRYAIIMALRSASIGDSFIHKSEDVKLSKILKQCIKTYKQKKFEESVLIDYHIIKAQLELPTISRDSKINERFIKFAKSRDNSENYGEAVGNLYVYEIIKFIKSIQIEGEEEVYEFENISVKDCAAVVESLPASLNTKIIEYIESVRAIENGFIETENGQLEISAAFFTKA
jgi:hypothetical protein